MLGSNILKVFGESPIKPMLHHMEYIVSCVKELQPFFEAVLKQDWERASGVHTSILKLESKADDLKKEIRLHLSNTLLMPIARIDLLSLLTTQDKVASKAKHIASLVLGRKTVLPETIASHYLAFVRRSIDSILQAQKAILELDGLLESGFKGRAVKTVGKMVLELDQIERDTDEFQVSLRQKLFEIEKTLDPIDTIFLYKIIDWTAGVADRAQHVGHRLESLLA
jgi:uncharacterized protein